MRMNLPYAYAIGPFINAVSAMSIKGFCQYNRCFFVAKCPAVGPEFERLATIFMAYYSGLKIIPLHCNQFCLWELRSGISSYAGTFTVTRHVNVIYRISSLSVGQGRRI